ncbi:sugar kinase [Tepidibacillus marianensis]|uniref:sugar kinase n=1 Tax=Tepidibacillus marianensis TaxID=3131995 RepID=UPI0030D382BF
MTIGEILVEIMAKGIDQKFSQTGEFIGPYPSGAPAIFIDQAAKIGSDTGIISKIGNDDFGLMNLNRLEKDGVNVKSISITNEGSTGVAFVTYKNNGDRDFIFHLKDSASGLISVDDVREEYFDDCNYFHVMGSSLFNENIRLAIKKGIEICKKKGKQISFDPNIRKEILKDEVIKEFIYYVLDQSNIFLPGIDELELLSETNDEGKSVKNLLEKGIDYIVVKKGSKGCSAYSRETSFVVEPLKVREVDPTGAGDCFAGTFISCMNKGFGFRKSVMYANTAGALAVTKKGPMEGNTTLEQLKEFVK